MQIGEILTSVQVPELIKDDFIRGGRFELSRRGLPIHFAGGFTIVFPCIVNGSKWAFRCWHNDLGNTRSRFQKLSDAMKNHPLKYLCEFHYVDEGIVVNGKTYPTTRMKWVDGMTIKDYVVANRHDKKALKSLAESFLQMCKELHANNYSHGDLQHGNIIVDKSGRLFLIDYDSLYHISMGDMPDIIAGLKDYQHPARKQNAKASEKADYFSETIIYTAILAIAENPTLAEKYDLENSESMLFQASDFVDFLNSQVYKDINSLGGVFPVLLEIISLYLQQSDINDLQPIETMMETLLHEPEINKFWFAPEKAVYVGDTITLNWDVKYALTQSLNDEVLDFSKDSYSTKIDGDKSFTLKIGNHKKTASRTILVKTLPLPEIEFKSDKDKVRKGQNEEFVLSWNVKKAKSVFIKDKDGDIIAEGFSGKMTLTTETDKVYIAEVVGLDGERVFKEQLSVSVFNASVVKFKADKLFTLPGVPVTLTWDVQHAESVELSGVGDVPPHGTHKIEPTVDTVVILQVKDKFGVTNYQQEIKMLPLPVVTVNPPTPAYNTVVTLVQPKTFVKLSVSLPQVPRGEMPSRIPGINFSLSPAFVTPNFALKRESMWHGIKDITCHLTKSFLNKFTKIRSHE